MLKYIFFKVFYYIHLNFQLINEKKKTFIINFWENMEQKRIYLILSNLVNIYIDKIVIYFNVQNNISIIIYIICLVWKGSKLYFIETNFFFFTKITLECKCVLFKLKIKIMQ